MANDLWKNENQAALDRSTSPTVKRVKERPVTLGGLRATLEGLRVSDPSCAEVLSVAGFFDHLGRFLLGREVYSEEREPPFLFREASLLQHQQ